MWNVLEDDLNPDCLNVRELRELAQQIARATVTSARMMYPDQPEGEAHFAALTVGQYCDALVRARCRRSKGCIRDAIRWENVADGYYQKLPAFAKW